MGTITESRLAKTGEKEKNSKVINTIFFIVRYNCMMIKIQQWLQIYRNKAKIYC